MPLTIKSLSGTSTRCSNSARPIRALLVPAAAPAPSAPSAKPELPPPVDLAKEEEAKKLAAEEEARLLAAEEQSKRAAAEEEVKRVAAEEQAKRIAAEEEARQAKTGVSKKTGTKVPPAKLAAVASLQQVDFNAEANKAARILGCQPLDAKVIGVEGVNIQYAVACDGSKTLNLSCDPSGLCLQRKLETPSKR